MLVSLLDKAKIHSRVARFFRAALTSAFDA
jgi:hypothetical protein